MGGKLTNHPYPSLTKEGSKGGHREMADYEQLMATLRNRRSIRRLKPDPVDDDLLVKLVDAARWAPSGNNSQPWEFVIIKDPQVIEQVGQIFVEQSEQRKKDKMPFH